MFKGEMLWENSPDEQLIGAGMGQFPLHHSLLLLWHSPDPVWWTSSALQEVENNPFYLFSPSHLIRLIVFQYNKVNQPAKETAEGQSHSKGSGGWAWDQNNVESRMACAAAQIGELLFTISEPFLCSAPPLNCSPPSSEGAFGDQLLVTANLLSAYLSSCTKARQGKNCLNWQERTHMSKTRSRRFLSLSELIQTIPTLESRVMKLMWTQCK